MTYDWLDTLRKEELPGLITYIHTTRPEKKKLKTRCTRTINAYTHNSQTRLRNTSLSPRLLYTHTLPEHLVQGKRR